ncbi:hypothetical protein SOCEGT47_073870 [Sorangium cellulosum]|uniref:Uncharacterized protein n=1 Tax=Sorangium cellulosum TaxID=56 RepID=A0A4P2QAX4_SORCE|nr:DUF3344 domain-containing protein [Sorangium cellulosum]AUX26817.1 hypothetical protein SOCEGT47_073870 [Sorangium cellulosum]
MRKQLSITGLASLTLIGLTAASATAEPKLRVQVEQPGDFALIGSSLGQECRRATPSPMAGTVGDCGESTVESGPDLFWRSDSPAEGRAEANLDIAPEAARTTAVLTLPEGATVTHAFLYWAARNTAGADQEVELHHEGGEGGAVTAIDSVETVINQGRPDETHNYQSVADITAIVKESGPGAYRVGGVDVVDVRNSDDDVVFAAWWMVVFYEAPRSPMRNLALFDGLDRVSQGNSQRVELSGFKVPDAGFSAKLGIIAFEGDNTNSGDSVFFNPKNPGKPDVAEALSDAMNPADNFFNSTRSAFGKPVSVEGDLPRIPGTPQSMSGVDIDIVDVSAKLVPGQERATLVATSTQELFFLAGWVTSIANIGHDFSKSSKVATDLGGLPTYRGDVVEYRITASNTGNDEAVGAVLTDPLPPFVTFVPGSLEIVEGPGAGPQTDAPGDDRADYDPGARTVTFRLGDGADGAQGGRIPAGESVTVRFAVTIDEDAPDVIANQAKISAAGALGAPRSDDLTDGNGDGAGAPPTELAVEPERFYAVGSGVFGPCAASPGGRTGGAAWLAAGLALAGLLRRRRRG